MKQQESRPRNKKLKGLKLRSKRLTESKLKDKRLLGFWQKSRKRRE